MSSFTGVSLVIDGAVHTTPAFDADTESGYHLLVVKNYARTVLATPSGKSIRSVPFMVGGHKWFIRFYPNGDHLSSADFISLDLCFDDDDDVENHVECEARFVFSFVNQVEMQNPTFIRSTKTRCFSVQQRIWGCKEYLKKDMLERSSHLKDNCLTIRCDIMVCNDLTPQQDAVGTLSGIGRHFKILLQDQVGSDVTFEVNSQTFPAHRCVLAARSKVFKAQLFGPMTEGITSGVIQIKDMDAKVFAALLSFIYSDSFPEMEEEEGQDEEEEEEEEEGQGQDEEQEEEEEAPESVTWLQNLFVAADRYDIQDLKFLCEKKLSKHMSVSSVASTLALAEQHHCHRLKEACLKFIQVQSLPCLNKVMETDDWKQITGTYGSVLNGLIIKLAGNQKTDNKRTR